MLQVYFLLVIANLIGGMALASPLIGEKFGTDALKFLLNPAFRKILGVIAVIAGLVGLLSVLPGDLPIIGNLLPALAAMMTGVGLFLNYQPITEGTPEWTHSFQTFLVSNASLVGMASIVLGVLHFLFPSAVLL